MKGSENIDIEQAYQSLKPMLYRLCWSFRDAGMEFDELLAIANLAFVESFRTYDSRKACFTTWVWLQVRFALMNAVNKFKRKRYKSINGLRIPANNDHAALVGLSDDALLIVKMIQDDIDRYLRLLSQKKSHGMLKVVIGDLVQRGWGTVRIANAIVEFRRHLRP